MEKLANTNSSYLERKLERFEGPHSNISSQLIRQAKAQNNNCSFRINSSIILPELINSPGLLVYDIESDPDAGHDFLHGFLSIRKESNGKFDITNAKYLPLICLDKNKEEIIWKRIKNKLNSQPSWPIIHYGETEVLNISRMAKRQGESENDIKLLKNRFIDIHIRVKKHWVLPVNSYGLKAVAKLIDFNWSQKNVSGAKALLWWRQWQFADKNRRRKSNNLNRILEYNFNDCLATFRIAKWLIKQD